MCRRITLDNNWIITGYGVHGERVGPFAGTVPGHVHTDLLRHGLMPDPMWRDQALQTQWVESYDWVYECNFNWPEGKDKEQATLCFEGLDTIATIQLNGRIVGKGNNMFVSYAFPIKEALQDGDNQLQVRFTAIPNYLQGKDYTHYAAAFSKDRVLVRRMQCTFGWDWVQRLVSYGIWKSAYVDSKPYGSITNTCMRTLTLEDGLAHLELIVKGHCPIHHNHLSVELFDPQGKLVWKDAVSCDMILTRDRATFTFDKRFTLDEPRLWWPAGYGSAKLYRLQTTLLSENGEIVDERHDESSGYIEIETDNYARVVTIEEELMLSDNYFDLMPGEVRQINYRTKNKISPSNPPKVTCWNGTRCDSLT